MANTINRHDNIATGVRDDVVGTTIKRNAWKRAAGIAIPLLLLILLATAAASRPDDRTPRKKGGGRKGPNKGIKKPGKFYKRSNITAVDTTKIDIDLLNNVAALRNRTILRFYFNEKRIQHLTQIKEPPSSSKGIIYWMHRDHRVQDNWAVLYAQKLALKTSVPLHVVFCTPTAASISTLRQYEFMIQGLKDVQSEFHQLNIPFHFVHGKALDIFSDFIMNHGIGAIVVDFMPLREFMDQVNRLAHKFNHRVPVIMVDAHNVISSWTASTKLATAPPKIYQDIDGKLRAYLTEFPLVAKHPFNSSDLKPEPINWEEADKNVKIDRSVLPVPDFKAGYRYGILELENFMKFRLRNYSRDSLNPMKNGLSNLSPWLHFGQISVQRVILEIHKFAKNYTVDDKKFLDEIITRRELSDLFCYRHQNNYDSVEGARYWARCALHKHRNDTREYLYTRDQFEKAQTHDDLWNASQLQMVIDGKMHRFLRMYWAKKILEWSDTPENALATSIYLNDKYSLDGNDPNSYNGCMWAICGIHDRPWMKGVGRPVFGTLRNMNNTWYQKVFDTVSFIQKYQLRSH